MRCSARSRVVVEVQVVIVGDRLSTVFAGQVEWTLAVERVGQVDTFGGWRAAVRVTVRNVLVTVRSGPARSTLTNIAQTVRIVSVVRQVHAGGTVLALIAVHTGGSLVLTADAEVLVVVRTGAVQSGTVVVASSTVQARIADASFRTRLTVLAVGTCWAISVISKTRQKKVIKFYQI